MRSPLGIPVVRQYFGSGECRAPAPSPPPASEPDRSRDSICRQPSWREASGREAAHASGSFYRKRNEAYEVVPYVIERVMAGDARGAALARQTDDEAMEVLFEKSHRFLIVPP
jgi:hypothetical protein